MGAEAIHELASAAETDQLGFALGQALGEPIVIALIGELGSGKTTFVRGLARGLGVEGPVNSPTYTLMQRYEGRIGLDHFDAWMHGREQEVLSDGVHETLGLERVSVIEWADKVSEWLPSARLEVLIELTGVHGRRATFRWLTGDGVVDLPAGLEAMGSWNVPNEGAGG